MRATLAACLCLLSTTALAQAADPNAPKGKLSDAAVPSAYRIDMVIDPDQPTFSGHDEIDVTLKAATSHLYMHGRDLTGVKATATVGGKAVPATYTQVDPTGVVRLDFASPLPAGKATLAFSFAGKFGESPSGLYRIKVANTWYSWTQFESIDARSAFPSFDEPGFKTPFTLSITTRPGLKAVSNAPEASVTSVGTMEKHVFQATRPLPTYLLAMMTGPFITAKGSIPADANRTAPLPLGAVATQAQAGKLDYVMAETPRIVTLLEKYFGQPFPFPKLDQIASPVMPGAMENAGADTYADELILLEPGAPTTQKQAFGMVVAHELSHQWFGDAVSPAWWDDIWLNESFANWMGFRIGGEWRPELNIGVGGLSEGFQAMNLDALEAGRPIHQPITQNSQIDSAFDQITYGKGGHVIAMIAAYMGDEKFRDGVRLHVKRHLYGNATTDQFFQSLADAAKDPRVLAAMRSFVDQQGVPVVSIARQGDKLTLSQQRYAFLGSRPAAESWTIPVCLRTAGERECTLLDKASATVDAPKGAGALIPNAGGTGYYRFDLSPADWQTLIAAMPTLPNAEAIAADDSLWASFRAGHAAPAELVAEMRAAVNNPDSNVAPFPGQRFAGLRFRGLIPADALPAYRKLIDAVYAPKLKEIGFDPKAGAHAGDSPDRQKLRAALVSLLAGEAQDPALLATLRTAGDAYLKGDKGAVDPSLLGAALGAVVARDGVPAAKAMVDRGLASEDPIFRGVALGVVSESGRADVARFLFDYKPQGLRATERLGIISGLAQTAETKDMATDWIFQNYAAMASGGNGIFMTARLPQVVNGQCSIERASQIEAALGPSVRKAGTGLLDYQRVVEQVRHCADLKAARSDAIGAAIKGA